MFNKLKQFKDLRDKAKTLQSALADVSVEGSAGFGKVKVTMDGNQKVRKTEIDETLLSDKAKLEELCTEAFNDAVKKVLKQMAEKMKGLEGFDFPGLG